MFHFPLLFGEMCHRYKRVDIKKMTIFVVLMSISLITNEVEYILMFLLQPKCLLMPFIIFLHFFFFLKSGLSFSDCFVGNKIWIQTDLDTNC